MLRLTREDRENREHRELARLAVRADESRGRAEPEEEDVFRTAFERDRDRIVHSKAFRRLKHKTQVFLNPDGDHYVTRMSHTIHVTQIGRAMARALGLNEDLTEAICLAHDVGHSPFGHAGEEALTPLIEGEWLHSAHGVRTVSILEPLNLSYEVLDGVRAHSWKINPPPETEEGTLCRYADRIAYLTHDVSDGLRGGVITHRDLPVRVVRTFGETWREWISAMVESVIETSYGTGHVEMDNESLDAMRELRDFMFERVYLRPESKIHNEKAITVIQDLVGYFKDHPEQVPETYTAPDADHLTRAIDYVAGMTDRFALRTHDRL